MNGRGWSKVWGGLRLYSIFLIEGGRGGEKRLYFIFL